MSDPFWWWNRRWTDCNAPVKTTPEIHNHQYCNQIEIFWVFYFEKLESTGKINLHLKKISRVLVLWINTWVNERLFNQNITTKRAQTVLKSTFLLHVCFTQCGPTALIPVISLLVIPASLICGCSPTAQAWWVWTCPRARRQLADGDCSLLWAQSLNQKYSGLNSERRAATRRSLTVNLGFYLWRRWKSF